MADWFEQNAPAATPSTPSAPSAVVAKGGDWFAQNAPPPAATSQSKAEPSWSEKAGKFLKDTFDKTTKAMNVTNTLDTIENIGDRLRDGDWGAIPDAIKVLPNFDLGNDPNGGAHQAVQQVQDTYSKIKAGDYSGATANVLPYVLVHGDAIGGKASDLASSAASSAASAAKEAAAKSPTVAGLKTLVPNTGQIITKLPGVADTIKTAEQTGKTVADFVDAYQKQKAANATDAAATAQRASGRTSLADQAGIQPETPTPTPDIEPIRPAAASARAMTPQGPPAAPIQPNAVRQAAADTRATLSRPPPAQATPTPGIDVAAAQQALRDRAAARKTTAPEAASTQAPPNPTANIDPAVLDEVAQWANFKSFDKVPLNSPLRQSIIDQAARFKPRADPMQKFEQAADVLTNPQNGAMADRIQAAMAHVDEGVRAAQPEPQPAPQHLADQQASTSATSKTDATGEPIPPPPGTSSSPSHVAEAKPAEPVQAPASPEEYYKPTGRGTTDVPTPGDLAKQGYYDGQEVLGKKSDSPSVIAHIASENEKAYNIADYLFNKEGVRTPEDFERIPVDEGLMERARQYGKSVENPVPGERYNTIINNKSLQLAMAHLGKMITEERLGTRTSPSSKSVAPDDMMEILNQSLQNLRSKNKTNP